MNARLVIPPEELEVAFARSGGPGGQNVNKVETKVSLRFDVAGSRALGDRRRSILLERIGNRLTSKGELLVHASGTREQKRNLEEARTRLAGILRDALQPRPTRKPTRATRGSRERRLATKKHRGQIKRDRGRADHD